MELIIKIAWRNIIKHKGKSAIIGMILFLGAFLMTIGNGVISGMDNGLKENILNRFTGHLVIVAKNQQENNVLFTMMGRSVEIIGDYQKVKSVLKQQNYINKFLPAAREFAMVLNEEGEPWMNLVFGVNFEDYQNMFNNNIVNIEGGLLKNYERGLLVTTKHRDEFFDYNNFWCVPKGAKIIEKNLSEDALKNKQYLQPRDELIFMGFNDKNAALDIRLPIKGIIKFSELNALWGHFNYIDIESFRECFGWITAQDNAIQITAEKQNLLKSEETNLDNLFGSEISLGSEENKKISDIDFSTKVEKKSDMQIDIDSGSYNLVFVKLKNNISIDAAAKKLEKALTDAKTNTRVITWKQAAGQIAEIAMIIRGALFGFVLFLFIVAIIIIMNTLSMAALERTSEIGMMRAVGATRMSISGMLAAELLFLSFIFGGLGIITGIIAVIFTSSLNLTTTNDILQLFYGGDTFRPSLGVLDIMLGVLQLGIVTFFSIIYPVLLARKITPLEAISRD